jgi:hypothetical protein
MGGAVHVCVGAASHKQRESKFCAAEAWSYHLVARRANLWIRPGIFRKPTPV